jgi:hypothetical protein
MFPLEHFYYGQLVHRGKPQKEMRLLAKSSQINDEQVAEAIRFALASPSEVLPQGTWALVRGRRTPFFLVQSQKGKAGQPIMHYIVMPTDVLRSLVGNIQALSSLIQDQLPEYDRLGDELVPITLTSNTSVSTDQQVDDLLDLMTYSKNKMNTIKTLLACVVTGLSLVVMNAPNDLDVRIKFIQGLLTLLPSSTRYGVTFAVATDSNSQMNLQVRFLDAGKPPSGSVVYDWQTGKIHGEDVQDDYSHFIISQFRLDAELVIQQTETLTPIAGWRFRNGDSLAKALSYASYRTKIDKAVTNNQPVEVADVSKVLSDDPTLTPELRVAYSRHLINLSLAIEDMQFAEPVAVMLHNNASLANDIHAQMTEALNDGQGHLIYETLLNWMGHPLGPKGHQWIELTYKAALSYLDAMINDEDYEGIDEYIDSIQSAPTGVAIGRVVPDVVNKLLPQLDQDEAIAMPLLSLAIQHMSPDPLEKVLTNPTLRTHMPQTMLNFLMHLLNHQKPPAPTGTLMAAVETLSSKSQKDALLKFTEMSKDNQRIDLVDGEALEGLFMTTQTTAPTDHASLLLQLCTELLENHIKQLDENGPRYLLQILYVLHQYDMLAKGMIQVSRDFYGIDRQFDYVAMVQKLFASVKITANEATTALVAIRRNGIKGLPYLTASVGILEGTSWSSNLERIAEEAIITLDENQRYLQVIQPATILGILEYYARQQNVEKMIETGRFIPTIAANREDAGPAIVRRMLKMMNKNRQTRVMSFEFLRQYIRFADNSIAKKAVRHFGQNMKPDARRKLEVSYVMSRFFGGVDLVTYTDLLILSVELLKDNAEAYYNNRPTSGQLQQMLDNIRIGFDIDDRQAMGKTLVQMGKAIASLYEQHKSAGNKGITGVLRSSDTSRSIIDIFILTSGVINDNQRYKFELKRSTEDYPFGKRTGIEILDQADITHNILRAPMVALPMEKPIKYTNREITDEIESQLRILGEEDRAYVRQTAGENLQKLVTLISFIASDGDSRALNDSTLSSRLDAAQRPHSTLEMYRYVFGFFND